MPDSKINGHTANGAYADIGELIYIDQAKKETILSPEFFWSEILQGTENDTTRGDIARAQIYDSEGNLACNPRGTLRIDELSFGKEITVFEDNNRNDKEKHVIYEHGTIVSEPYFADDDLWWVDVERKDYAGNLIRRPRCLGILGVTMNDNREWNPFYYVVSTPFEPESIVD